MTPGPGSAVPSGAAAMSRALRRPAATYLVRSAGQEAGLTGGEAAAGLLGPQAAESPARIAGGEHGPQLITPAVGDTDVMVAAAAGQVSARRRAQPADRHRAPDQFGELEVVIPPLLVGRQQSYGRVGDVLPDRAR